MTDAKDMYDIQNNSMCESMMNILLNSRRSDMLFVNRNITDCGPHALQTDRWGDRCKMWSDTLTSKGYVVHYHADESTHELPPDDTHASTIASAWSWIYPEWIHIALPQQSAAVSS